MGESPGTPQVPPDNPSRFPPAESIVVPEATHAISMTDPTDTDGALSEFFAEHPME